MAPARSLMFLAANDLASAAFAAAAAGGILLGEIRIRIELSHQGVAVSWPSPAPQSASMRTERSMSGEERAEGCHCVWRGRAELLAL